jgi:hypothetical protein
VGDFVGQAATTCFFSSLTGDCEKWGIFVRIFRMAMKNYLVEGVSGAGKTSVCDALIPRGFLAIHGDREFAYQGDPETGEPVEGRSHQNHIWHVDK